MCHRMPTCMGTTIIIPGQATCYTHELHQHDHDFYL